MRSQKVEPRNESDETTSPSELLYTSDFFMSDLGAEILYTACISGGAEMMFIILIDKGIQLTFFLLFFISRQI